MGGLCRNATRGKHRLRSLQDGQQGTVRPARSAGQGTRLMSRKERGTCGKNQRSRACTVRGAGMRTALLVLLLSGCSTLAGLTGASAPAVQTARLADAGKTAADVASYVKESRSFTDVV